MRYLLKHHPININSTKLSREYFQINSQIYFVPNVIIEVLQDYVKDKNNSISKAFVVNYFTIIDDLIEAQLTFRKTLTSRRLEKIRNYKSILDLLTPKFIINKINYSTACGRCNRYILDLSSENWSFVYLEEIGTTNYEKTMDIALEENHPSNNDNYKEALINSEIDVYNAIIAEINGYKGETDRNAKCLKIKKAITKILSFKNRRSIKKGTNVNRVFNSFTFLSKVSRKFIRLNGKVFTEIDIPNCQPLLLLVLLKKNGICPDPLYVNDVLNGVIYERIMEKALELGYKNEVIASYEDRKRIIETFDFTEREDVKTLCYRSIYFKLKNENSSITASVFKELYPLVFEALKNGFNTENDKNVAFHLQNMEAEIILNIIPDCPYFTVHDSIAVIDEKEVESVKTQISQKISEYLNRTINLNLRVKRLVNETYETTGTDTMPSNVLTCPIRIHGKYKTHKRKQVNYDKFKLICGTYTRAETIVELKISSKTYLRYLEEYKQEQVVQIA